ncbi:hypothetical protein MKX83_19625 [Cytobacillus sp. FSL M8-0252]|uniref:hypothetical protein n=1 Tax=Cytobacillus sp. FSL M8-0252 TaxID=2921621 RepID=UPI0030FC32C9
MSDFERKVAERMKRNEQSPGVDPSPSNPARSKPRPVDNEQKGRSLYQRLKQAGKIRNK